MKRLQILFFSLLCCSVLMAQSDPSPTVFSQVGKAKLVKPGVKKKMKVRAGSALGQEGTLILKKNTTVGVFFDDGYTYLTGPGTFEVAPLMESSKLEESDFMGILGDQLVEVQHPYFNQGRSGFGSGGSSGPSSGPSAPVPPPSKKDIPGHGNKEADIVPLSPLSGKVSGKSVTFQWEPKSGEASDTYTLKIEDSAGEVVFSRDISGQSITLSAVEAALKSGVNYSWTVAKKSSADSNSGKTLFDYATNEGAINILERLNNDVAYQKAAPAAKALFEIAALERFEHKTEAVNRLMQARKNFKKNPLIRSMNRLYLWKYGLAPN